VQCRELVDRVFGRLLAWPRKDSARALVALWLGGSVLMVAFGFATNFFTVQVPKDRDAWGQAMVQLCMLLGTPGILEEVLFRGLLLPRFEGEQGVPCRKKPPSREGVSAGAGPRSSAQKAEPPEATESHADPEGGACGTAGGRLPAEEPGVLGTLSPDDVEVEVDCMRATSRSAVLSSAGPAAPLEEPRAQAPPSKVIVGLARSPSGQERPRPPLFDQVVALVIFVVYHQDLIHTWKIFRDWRFLGMAAILGVCCQEALLRSRSLWPGIMLHCLWVWGWLTFGTTN
jgi:membrane protease YdiL (CAAX protease family)